MDTFDIRYARTVRRCQHRLPGAGPRTSRPRLHHREVGNFEIEFEAPWGVHFVKRLSSFSRVILFDKRGAGRPTEWARRRTSTCEPTIYEPS